MSDQFGTLKYLRLNEVWKHEGHDFTPWLVKDENLALLSEAVGLDLQLERTEVPVGPYSADVLARDSDVGYVVIENQYNKTNHDHLGKLITYGAALNASAVIWVAEDFSEEHQKAIEWLNDHTSEELSLYAVRLEIFRIDDSKPAIKFNVLSRPNETVRAATVAKTSGELTDAQKLQLEFWTLFQRRLLERKVIPNPHTPRPQYWFDVPLGRTDIFLSNTANTYDGRIGVRVYLRGRVADAALAQLGAEKGAIESEIGETLEWNPNPHKKDKIIAFVKKVDFDDRAAWPDYVDWLVTMTAKFRAAFIPRVKKLVLTSGEASPHE